MICTAVLLVTKDNQPPGNLRHHLVATITSPRPSKSPHRQQCYENVHVLLHHHHRTHRQIHQTLHRLLRVRKLLRTDQKDIGLSLEKEREVSFHFFPLLPKFPTSVESFSSPQPSPNPKILQDDGQTFDDVILIVGSPK